MTTQRKIPHLLSSSGDGPSFRYHAEIGVPIDITKPVIITEKVDGSTMQSHHGLPYKRYDRMKAGDPRKHSASEEERYELRACCTANRAEQWYLAAFDAHCAAFLRFGRTYPDHWVYFEALGQKIGARCPGLLPTVRVFDVAVADGPFLPFDVAVTMVQTIGLPVVAAEVRTFASLGHLLAELSTVSSALISPETGMPYVLEGWVLRQDNAIAKIRVGDLKRIS